MMNASQLRLRQVVSWLIVGVFVAGFFVAPIGALTGPTLGLWFIGTQRPRRGLVWMLGFSLAPDLIRHARELFSGQAGSAFMLAGTLLFSAVFGVLPFLFHRLIGPRLAGAWVILPFPCAVLSSAWMAHAVLQGRYADLAPRGPDIRAFLAAGAAATLLWVWNQPSFRAARFKDVTRYAAVFGLLVLYAAMRANLLPAAEAPLIFGGIGTVVCVMLGLWAVRVRGGDIRWSARPESVALLRSPISGERLHVEGSGSSELLMSSSGERFPIDGNIPVFVRPQDVTGQNLKYNHLYQTIGGFYDDSQRVVCALTGMDRDAYVMKYLGRLEVRPGDRVLETSVGTGLNFQYLPREIRRMGLDLSAAMLDACRLNLQRWKMDADLVLGNAEWLPFADDAFDVVFHVGGINFFSDRGRAIREMIRVAKPGSLILIADETEEHVQRAYENIPVTREYFKDRTETVAAPVDLIPEGMEEIRLETIQKGRFYALTFRKPGGGGEPVAAASTACASALK
jgi:ubiquinone/menaquinone biosynthesis C-methylase UbiE